MHRLIEGVAPKFEGRGGGYTRLIHLPQWRIGDAAPLAVLQFVGEEEAPGSVTKPKKSARQRRADSRYAMAVRAAKGFGKKDRAPAAAEATTDAT
jgi:hypothetical protein